MDLRNYPDDYFGSIFLNYFGARETVVNVQVKADLSYPVKFIISEQKRPSSVSKYQGRVLLIVNEFTQSRAEYTAMQIQNGYNVTTIGSLTAGAGGIMVPLEFIGGFSSYFTNSGIFYPDMTPVQRKGVKIDIEVKPTLEGVAAGRDEVLEKEIELASVDR